MILSRASTPLLVAALAALPAAFPGELPADPPAKSLQEALETGKYEEAIEGFRKLAEEAGAAPGAGAKALLARRGWAEGLASTGKYGEALAALREGGLEESAALAGLAGRILRNQGKLDEARAVLSRHAADEKAPRADRVECLVELGRVDENAGRLDEARASFERSIDLYQEIDADEAEALPARTFVLWALALMGLNRYGDANRIMFQQAEEKDPRCPELLLERGRAFLEKYNFPDSREMLQEALGRNPRFAEAQAVLAENLIADHAAGPDRFEKAEKALQAALEANPRSAVAYRARGSLWLYDGNLGKAQEDFRKALEENPAFLEARGLLAACFHLQDDRIAFAREEAAARSVNPRCAAFYHAIAQALEQRFRYMDVVRMCDRALERDPGYWPAYVTLGINCFRTGENARGRQFLEKSWEKDKFNVWVYNTRKLIRYMDENFTTHEEGGFVFFFDRKDAPVLRTYLAPFLEQARKTLEARYKTRLDTPIQVEAFSEHQWFSARTVGLPDFAALGATFGKLMTLTTPKAFPQNWGVVAWHELAHVAALQMTGHRVPRWFTEGLSVYEEGLDRPEWGRNFARELADSWASRQLLPLSRIDYGFTKPKHPKQILISYYQGCMAIRLIVERWGFEKVLEILRGYGDGKGTEAVFRECLGMSLEDFDGEFEKYMARWVESTGYRPRRELDKAGLLALENRAAAAPKDAALLADLAWAHFCTGSDVDASLTAAKALEADPRCGDAHAIQGLVSLKEKRNRQARESFEKALEAGTRFAACCHARLGSMLMKEKETRAEARDHLEEAKRLSPVAECGFPPQGNVYYLLAKLYEEDGDEEKANRQMMELARFAVENPECRQRIVQHALRKKDHALAAKYLEELLYLNPFDGKLHALLAQAAEDLGNLDLTIRENKVLLAFPESNPRKVRLALARAYLAKGDRPQAAQEARKVLEIDPIHEEAQEILKKASGG